MKDIILDLGCGKSKEIGAIGVDNVQLEGVDIVHDLLDIPYPFENESIGKVYLKHIIEHFVLEDIQRILLEVYRILQPGGIVHIRVPHAFSVSGCGDPTHRMAFMFISGHFFDKNSHKAYYKEINSCWELGAIKSRVTWFNWKRYRMRKIDYFISRLIAKWLDWLLGQPSLPGSADLLVKLLPLFFVEIRWVLHKPIQS